MPWLTPQLRSDVSEGDGNELVAENGRPKSCALHSSSALALNVLGYWAQRDRMPLARALSLASGIASLRPERKYPTGVGDTLGRKAKGPNIDFEIVAGDQSLLAVESKFEETYRPKRRVIADAYFPAGAQLWRDVGLTGAQLAAEAARDGTAFEALDVPQLLKHMLGLSKSAKPGWRLMLLWYEVPLLPSDKIRTEIDELRTLLGVDSNRFMAKTYQELWGSVVPLLSAEHQEYRRYVGARYFESRSCV